MTNEQHTHATICLQIALENLQTIANGQHEYAQTLEKRWQYADWQLCRLLRDLIPTLPRALREQVQACYDLREHIWSDVYWQAYYDAQQKASPTCLAAQDSL